MGVIVTDQHFLMIQTLPERIHHEQVCFAIKAKMIIGGETRDLQT